MKKYIVTIMFVLMQSISFSTVIQATPADDISVGTCIVDSLDCPESYTSSGVCVTDSEDCPAEDTARNRTLAFISDFSLFAIGASGIVAIIYSVILLAKIFNKHDGEWWAVIIPIYPAIKLAKIAKKNPILVLISFIPGVGQLVYLVLYLNWANIASQKFKIPYYKWLLIGLGSLIGLLIVQIIFVFISSIL